MTIKAFLFDKDGTLISFEKTYGPSTVSVIKHLSDDDEQLANALAKSVDFHFDGNRFEPTSIVIAGSGMDIATKWAPLLERSDIEDLAREVDALYADYSTKYAEAFSFTSATLDQLRELSIPLGIATNDSEQGALNHMGELGLTDRFEMIIGADSGYGAKPKPDMILAFADKLGLSPSEIAMVGDSTHDLITAKNAGAIGIGVTTGMAVAKDLAPHADHVFDTIEQLPTLIRR